MVVGVILITMMVMFNHKVHNDTGFGLKIMHSAISRFLGYVKPPGDFVST
jgi:hypothetical protein